jgi:PD-(D/E)XK nuclease superfamily
MPILTSDRHALESFITSDELVRLETRFAHFNVFEVLNVERRELNHSNFLSFLLDPYESHGLRDLFLRRFLQDVVKHSEHDHAVSAIDLDSMDLMTLEVRREYKNIDILLHNSDNKLVVVIENKVESKQHSNQLERYYEIAAQEFSGLNLLAIYLTPSCDDPKNSKYIAYSYEKVRSLVLEVLERKSILINDAVRSTLSQYADLLGRRFMADIELQKLCANIYRQHKQAVDILIENIPNEMGELAGFLRQLIVDKGFTMDDSNNSYVRFIPENLDLPFFRGSSWTNSGRLVLFEFMLTTDSVTLIMQIGPGPSEKREAIHKFALANTPVFSTKNSLSPKYSRLYSTPILRSRDYEKDLEERQQIIRQKWNNFLSVTLSKIENLVLDHKWVEPAGSPDLN